MSWTLVGVPDPITLDDLDFLEHIEWETDQWFPIRDTHRGDLIIAFLRLTHPIAFKTWIKLATKLSKKLVELGYTDKATGVEILGTLGDEPPRHIAMDSKPIGAAEAESIACMCQLQVFVV